MGWAPYKVGDTTQICSAVLLSYIGQNVEKMYLIVDVKYVRNADMRYDDQTENKQSFACNDMVCFHREMTRL